MDLAILGAGFLTNLPRGPVTSPLTQGARSSEVPLGLLRKVGAGVGVAEGQRRQDADQD